jgi:hypothetical protein
MFLGPLSPFPQNESSFSQAKEYLSLHTLPKVSSKDNCMLVSISLTTKVYNTFMALAMAFME